MRTMSHYLIIMLSVILFVFRLIVVFTTTMGIEFGIQSYNVNFEIILLFIMIPCIILMSKSKLIGAIVNLLASIAYFGPYVLNQIMNISANNITQETALEIIVSLICIIIPIFAFFIVAMAKKQELKPVDKKTDFFYKNENYDRKYDDRADKNNYRTL